MGVVSFGGENILELGVGGWLHSSVDRLKTTELYTLKGRMLWSVNYILIKQLFRACVCPGEVM